MLLRASELRIDYSTPRGTVNAVDGVSFSVEQGEILVIVGESGSGKSSVGLAIPGLIGRSTGASVDGVVEFERENLSELHTKALRRLRGEEIAMIFQNARSALNPVRTVGDQLTETVRAGEQKMSATAAKERSVQLLEMVGIPDPSSRMKAYPHLLSGGMCQRVMIALAIALSPRLLIADEPTSALDVTVKVQILQLLKDLASNLDMAVVMITHDLSVARAVADKVSVMYAGQIVEMGNAAEVLDSPQMPYTKALLASRPKLDGKPMDRLAAIPGRPPNLDSSPSHCRFAARCAHVQDICLSGAPDLYDVGDGHKARCFFPYDPAMQAKIGILDLYKKQDKPVA